MTLRETDLTAEDVMAVRDRTLAQNYEPHDVAQEYLESTLEGHGYETRQHGDEKPEADEVFFGAGPDVSVHSDSEIVCYVEIKSKRWTDGSGVEWYGRLNRRMWNEYVSFSETVGVPVFVYFALVDEDESLIRREGFVEVVDTDTIYGNVVDISSQDIVFRPEAIRDVDGTDLKAIDTDEIVGLGNQNQLVDGIPNVHGNDVVEIDDSEFRSLPHVLYRISDTE